MGFRLSIYSQRGFKEYLLPAINNSDYSITLSSDVFGLKRDLTIPFEIVEEVWRLNESDFFTFNYLQRGKLYAPGKEHAVLDGDIIAITTIDGDMISIIAKESDDYFAIYKKFELERGVSYSIGGNPENVFYYQNKGLVSRRHAAIFIDGEILVIEDYSANGTFVNGMRIDGAKELKEGDCVDIFGLRIVYYDTFIAINPLTENLVINEARLREYIPHESKDVSPEKLRKPEKKLFHRSPRNIPKIETEPVEIEAPPSPKEPNRTPAIMTIGPSMTMALPMLLGTSMAIYSSRMSGGGSSAFMYTGLITAVGSALIGTIWAILNLRNSRKQNREDELKRFESYGEYLINCANDIKEKYRSNARAMKELYPDAQECCTYTDNTTILWNRNYHHDDFLSHRLGVGAVPFQVAIEVPKEKFSMINDNLAEKPRMIRENYKYLRDVPVCVDLQENRLIGLIGGARKKGCYQVCYNLATQIAAFNSYTDVKMVFIYDETKHTNSNAWDFARWLPHTWSQDKKVRYVAGNKQDASEILYDITNILRQRTEEKDEDGNPNKRKIHKPHFILFIEDTSLIEGDLISKYIFSNEMDCGLSTLIMVDSYEGLPNECEYIIENTEAFKGMYYVYDGVEDRIKINFDSINHTLLDRFARRLSPIEVSEEEVSGEIPSVLSFFDMYHIKRPDELDVLNKWRKNRTYESMRALVGQKTGGADCYLDVHEKYHGPHGLVAGTTGSGKSETLQTYMLSLALNFSPDDVGFFIIDYKGGGMANLFDGLPHMIGQISNLSGNQVRRAMVSIKSENVRRQRIFNEHGVNNINLYTRLYKNNEATIPVPHMFIIIDEFAELKREEPDFMRELISVAQVGRSLGVHLILATQKPSGTVDDNIWSNSKFRLCLRVQDRQDSMDMLHKPDAAYITQAGRSYLQVGNDELYELFQSAWSGATYDESVGGNTDIAEMVSINGRAALVGSFAKIKRAEENKISWINNLLDAIDSACIENKCSVKDCAVDNSLRETVMNTCFGLIESRKIDYPYNEYNAHRLQDLINAYSTQKDEGTDRRKIAENLIRLSSMGGLKLPEMKEKTQLDAVKDYIALVAKNSGFDHSFQLWLPVLPEELYLDDLTGYSLGAFDGIQWRKERAPQGTSLSTMIGMMDDPENQSQQPISIDLATYGNHAILGTVVSGKSTFLLTYIYSLINHYSPDEVNLYILDFSSKMLSAFDGVAHVGGIMYEDDNEKIGKFFTMMNKILEERKQLFKGGSYSQYIRAHGLELPSIIIAIDNMGSFRNKTNGIYDDNLMTILKEGANYGIYVIATAANFSMNEIPMRMGDNFRNVMCLEMSDRFAYTEALRTIHIDTYPEENVKGRGIYKNGDSILEFQTCLPLAAEDDYKRAELIKEKCRAINNAWKGKIARPIPEIPENPVWSEFAKLPDVEAMAKKGSIIPLGYDRQDASAYGIDLSNIYCYMVSGKARTGKSNALRIAISSAHMVGGEIVVIDFTGDLERVTENVGGRYVDSVEAMEQFFRDLLPQFKERNERKKSYSKEGLSTYEVFEKMQSFEKIFIFVSDLSDFIQKVENPGGDIESMGPFVKNILEKGALHNVFWFAGFNQDDRTLINSYDTYKQFVKDGKGIHLGGRVDDQQTMAFDHIPFVERSKSLKSGIGLLPTHDEDNTSVVVIPFYKAD